MLYNTFKYPLIQHIPIQHNPDIGVETHMSEHKEEKKTPIIELKPRQEDIHVTARVIEAGPPRVIQTRKGPRTISDAVLGDETGRVKTTLWGRKAGTLEEGTVVDVKGAWTSSYRGEVQLNIGSSTEVNVVEDTEAPPAEEVPEDSPKAPDDYRPRPRGGYGRRRSFGGRY